MPPKRAAAAPAKIDHETATSTNKRAKTSSPAESAKSKPQKKATATAKVAGKRRTKQPPPSRSPTPVTYEELEACATELIQASGKSENTLSTYRRLVGECIEYLRTFRRKESREEKRRCSKKKSDDKPEHEAHNAPDQDPSDSPENPTTMDPEFPHALDGPPKACTPLAITLFIYHKCGPGKRGRSLADQIHAAIAWHYDEMDGDRYRNWWAWDSAGKCWVGNPARSARVKSMLATIKKEHAHDPRSHSRATSLADMQAMHRTRTARLKELEGETDLALRCERAELVLFGALSSIAWVVWLRCGEIVNLRFGDLDLTPPERLRSNGTPFEYIIASVCKRKNWTVKDETELTGHIYHLYKRSDQAAIDAHTLIHEWISEYTDILGRPLKEDDILFPTINTSLRADPNKGLHEDKVRKLVRKHAGNAGLAHVEGYKSHCFRRGGAQYRFMYAPLNERWTLSRIRWWGGWANSEQGDTLVKYLLDELFTYEEDHRDALQPNEDGFTTDLRGLEERKEMRAAERRNDISEDIIADAVTRAVTAVLANQPWKPCSHPPSHHVGQPHERSWNWAQSSSNSPLSQAGQWGRPLGHTDINTFTAPSSIRQPPQNLHRFQHSWEPHPAVTQGSDFAVPTRPRQAHSISTPASSYPPPSEYQPLRGLCLSNPRHSAPSSFHPYLNQASRTLSTHLHTPPTHRPPATSAPIPHHSLPAHSRADFAVAPQPTFDTQHYVHHWDSHHHQPQQSSQSSSDTSLPPLPPSTYEAAPSTAQPDASMSPYGHLAVPKIDRTSNPKVLANLWKQVIDDWEGKDPQRCPVPLRDWKDGWHKKTPQAMVYHQRKVIAEEFIDYCGRDEALFLERYPAHASGISALVVAITQARKDRNQIRGRASKNS